MTFVTENVETFNGTGLEEIATEAFALLSVNLNDQIAIIEEAKEQSDIRVAELKGIDFQPVEIQRVQYNNFHLGHTPSLISDNDTYLPPVEWFPAISVMAYRANPAPSSTSYDQASVYTNNLYVEAIVVSSELEGQDICNKRIWRTVESVIAVIDKDRTLNGVVSGLDDPTVLISEVFARPESDLNLENTWFWQAGRIEYPVRKFSPSQW